MFWELLEWILAGMKKLMVSNGQVPSSVKNEWKVFSVLLIYWVGYFASKLVENVLYYGIGQPFWKLDDVLMYCRFHWKLFQRIKYCS